MAKILVSGGSGYIGSHTCVELVNAGFDVVVIDSLRNSRRESLRRVEQVCGRVVQFYQLDVRDRNGVAQVFRDHEFSAVIHFAGLKAVGESVERPLDYYDVNVIGSLALIENMAAANVKTLIFSSSATVYGNPISVPIDESFAVKAINPYGRTKLIVEDILRDLYHADNSWRIALLRYFNPVGAHESGLMGEDPTGIPNNLMPIVAQVAAGKLKEVQVYGSDYPTADGTCVRDYVHVVDLAGGHVKTLEALRTRDGFLTLNLGTGRGFSVLEVIRAFESECGRPIPYRFVPRRAGDVSECFADPSLALSKIGWRTRRDLRQMCLDAWRWQRENPDGFGDREDA